jgi:magnesium chelatase family protein
MVERSARTPHTFALEFRSALHGRPCGFASDPDRECTCTQQSILRYQRKLSGPLLDRIDVHVEVPRVEYEKLTGVGTPESSADIRTRVQQAREIQLERFSGTRMTCNAEMGPKEVRSYCPIEPAAQTLVKAAVTQLHLSARAFHRTLKLARTVADLAGAEVIGAAHVAEAIQYRPRAVV